MKAWHFIVLSLFLIALISGCAQKGAEEDQQVGEQEAPQEEGLSQEESETLSDAEETILDEDEEIDIGDVI